MAEQKKPRKKKDPEPTPEVPKYEPAPEDTPMLLLNAAESCLRDAIKQAALTAHPSQIYSLANNLDDLLRSQRLFAKTPAEIEADQTDD